MGTSARTILIAVAKSVQDGHPVRLVQAGENGGASEIALPAAVLRSSAVQWMGSGLKSLPLAQLLESAVVMARRFVNGCDLEDEVGT